ncbi:MAG: winged helix-turn-helix domain-containing protein [Acidobacteriaceae bacterium]|jgi:TolB-like protein/DNA-binding winged helix-turn-helix (wHTH) protein/Tfp pilus assembly protein PilF
MEAPATSRQCVRFGEFELDFRSEELRKHGNKVKLQGQPLKILAILLARPGEMVTREALGKELWPEDTFVDFDSGLNSAIKKLREALGDSRESSRFIETLPRRGYRFIAPVEEAESAAPGPSTSYEPPVQALADRRLSRYQVPVMAGAGVLALLLISIATYAGRWRERLGAETRPRPGTGQQSIQSLAVLPLENLSSDPDQEYFAEGMTDALTTDLAKISTLKVISRTSSMQFKATKKPLQQIAKELNVDALVEGTVERSGSRVRITAQLIDARNDRNLWAESYERDLRDVLGLQSQVARAIASEINVDLQPQERGGLATVRQVDPEAEIAYLRGRYEMDKWTREGFKEGFRYFEQAVQQDPAFAEAWAGLSDAYFEWGEVGIAPKAETLPKARAAAQKALELDETLSEAHVSVATIAAAGWMPSAEKELQRAIALDPSNVRAHQAYGIYLRQHGRLDQSLVEMERAEELDPLTSKKKNNLGAALYYVGRYDEALEWFKQVPDPDLDSERRHRRMAEIYEHKKMQKEAIAEFVASLRFGGKADLAARVERSYLSSGYAEAKETLLRGEVDWAEKQAKSGTVPEMAFWIARDYAILGDKNKAVSWVETAYQNHSTGLEEYNIDPQLADLRSDPRIQELARRFDPRP